MFSKEKNAGIELYKEFVLKENSENITRILGRIRVPPVLGDDRFIKWVKESFFNQKYDKEVAAVQVVGPEFRGDQKRCLQILRY